MAARPKLVKKANVCLLKKAQPFIRIEAILIFFNLNFLRYTERKGIMATGQGDPQKGKSKAKDTAAEKKQQTEELTEADLDNVAGGASSGGNVAKKQESISGRLSLKKKKPD
jgi:hypothetical protein